MNGENITIIEPREGSVAFTGKYDHFWTDFWAQQGRLISACFAGGMVVYTYSVARKG